MIRKVFGLAVLLGLVFSLGSTKKITFRSALAYVADTLLIDAQEVAIGDWMAYMHGADGDLEGWQSMLPDTNVYNQEERRVWQSFLPSWEETPPEGYRFVEFWGAGSFSPFTCAVPDNWNRNQKRDFEEQLQRPVVGISFDQVKGYLAWREEIFSEFEQNLPKDDGGYYQAVLPSKVLWESVAKTAGPRMSISGSPKPDSINAKGCMLMRVKELKPCESTLEGEHKHGKTRFPVAAGYMPDNYGMYNFYGNVAEMTATSGIAKGGSYQHFAAQSFSGKNQAYSEPSAWLGFRVYYVYRE